MSGPTPRRTARPGSGARCASVSGSRSQMASTSVIFTVALLSIVAMAFGATLSPDRPPQRSPDVTAVAPKPITSRPYPARRAAKGSVLLKMMHTTDPKDIAILYLVTTFAFFLAGGYKYAMAGEGACFRIVMPCVAPTVAAPG